MTGEDVGAFIFIYLFISFWVGLVAVLNAVDAHPVHNRFVRRKHARIALTCWAWPVYLAIVLWRGMVWLIEAAR